jgi:hypothetical protein
MAITSSTIDVYVEPQVSSITLTASPVLNSSQTPSLTFSGTALDSSSNGVPGATVTLYLGPVTSVGYSAADVIANSTSTSIGSTSVALTDSSGNFSFSYTVPSSSYTNIAGVVAGEGVQSNVVIAYLSATIAIAASTTEPEVGTNFTVTVTVKDADGNGFGSGGTDAAMNIFDGTASVVLWVEDISSSSVSDYSLVVTGSNGEAVFTVNIGTVGGYKLQAVAYGNPAAVNTSTGPSDL